MFKRATTTEELHAVYHFRYEYYVHKMKRIIKKNVDHNKKMIMDDPTQKERFVFYAEDNDKIIACFDFVAHKNTPFPQDLIEQLSLNLFAKMNIQALVLPHHFIIDESFRKKNIAQEFVKTLVLEALSIGAQAIFAYCVPGLLHYYELLGFCSYTDKLIYNENGMLVPLLIQINNSRTLNKLNLPEDSIKVLEEKIPSELKTDEVYIKRHPVKASNINDELLNFYHNRNHAHSHHSLSPAELDVILKYGKEFNVEAGRLIVREGNADKELFIILSGVVKVERMGWLVGLLSDHDMFGEIALISESGTRTMSVLSVTECRLFVIRRGIVNKMMVEEPTIAAKLLFHIAQTISARFEALVASI